MAWVVRGHHKRKVIPDSIIDGLLQDGHACQSDLARKWLGELSLCSASSWLSCTHEAGPLGSRAMATKRTTVALSTEDSPVPWDKYMRVLRRPTDKAKVFNRSNWELWHDSGLDVGIAKQFLAELELTGRTDSPAAARKALLKLVRDASKLSELQLLVEELQGALQVEELLCVIDKATYLMDQELQADASKWSHQNAVRQQATSLVNTLATQVVHRLSDVPTSQLAALMYSMSRTHLHSPDLEHSLAEELTANRAFRLSETDPAKLAALLRSAALLGWHKKQQAAWACLTSSVAACLDTLEPEHVAHVVSGVCAAGDQSGQLWSSLMKILGSRGRQWAVSHPVAVTDMLFSIAKSGSRHQLPVEDLAGSLTGSRHLGTLPPRTLARMAFSVAVLGREQPHSTALSASSTSSPPTSPACTAFTRNILSAAGTSILSLSVPDMCHLLEAQLHCGSGSQQDLTSAILIKGVMLARGIKASHQLPPTIKLVNLLHRLNVPVMDLAQVLGKQGLSRLSVLSPHEAASLMTVMQQHGDVYSAAHFITAAAPYLQQACQADAGSALLAVAEGLVAACRVLSAVPEGQVVPAGLSEAARGLADSLASLPSHSVQAVKEGHRKQVVAALRAAQLQDHALITALS